MKYWIVTHGDGAALQYVSNQREGHGSTRRVMTPDIDKAMRFLRPGSATQFLIHQPPALRAKMNLVVVGKEVFA